MEMKQKVIRALKYIKHVSESSWLVSHCRDWTANIYVRCLLIILVFPFCVFKYFRVKDIPGREGLAFILIAKNEAPYIEEWINFHHKQGVSHFIIFDNDSTDNFHEVLKPYIASGLVTYRLLSGRARQYDAYNIALNDYGRKFKYMGFIDADEFVFVRNNTYGGHDLFGFIDGFMKAYPNAGGIGINWCIFGSNGHIAKPEGGVLENYTMRAEDSFYTNRTIKTICDPTKVFALLSSHCPICRRGFQVLDENGETIEGSSSQAVHFSKIRINHYFTKSLEDYQVKIARGRVDFLKGTRSMKEFDTHDKNDIHDTEILSLV